MYVWSIYYHIQNIVLSLLAQTYIYVRDHPFMRFFFGKNNYVIKFDVNNFSVSDMARKKYSENTLCL